MHNTQIAIMAESLCTKILSIFSQQKIPFYLELLFKGSYVTIRFPKLNSTKATTRSIEDLHSNTNKSIVKVDDYLLSFICPSKRDTNIDELKMVFPLKMAKLTSKKVFNKKIKPVEEDFIKLLEFGEALN